MRLIDADKAKEKFCGYCTLDPERCGGDCSFLRFLNRQQTVDPVKHGHWVAEYEEDGECLTRCSECNERIPTVLVRASTYEHPYGEVVEIENTPYCPHCGAKMDEPEQP